MPQVPIYNGPQVREQATQGGYQQEVDVTKGQRALAGALNNVAEVADRIDFRDAQDAAFKADDALREEWGNQSAALRDKYKKDSADQYKTAADEWWAEARTRYTAALSPRAQALANRSIGQFKLAQDADTRRYVETEKAAARKVNYTTLQNRLIRDASVQATPENAATLAQVMGQTLRENAIKHAVAEGYDSKIGEAEANEALDRYHGTMAISLAGRPNGAEYAKEYLNQFGGNMPIELRDRVLDQIGITADKATAKASKEMYGNLRFSIANGVYPTKNQYEALRLIDSSAAAQIKEIENAQRKAARVEAQGGSIKTNQKAYFELRDRVLAGEKVDVLAYGDRVSRADLEEVKKMQEKINNPVEQKKIFSEERTIDNYRPTDMKKDSGEWTKLRRTLEDTLIAAQAAKGKDLTDTEMRAALDPLFTVGTIEKNWWPDSSKKRYEMTPEEVKQAKFPDKFTAGQVYKDSKGNRAKYLGSGNWEPVK